MSIVVDRPAKLRSQRSRPFSKWPRDPVGSMPEQPVPNEAELLEQNHGWVLRVLHRYGRPLADLVGWEEALVVSQIGMLHAIRVWDPDRGSLTNTGLLWMRSQISKAIEHEKYRSGDGKTRSLDAEIGREGSGFSLADAMQLNDDAEGSGQVADGEEVAMWFAAQKKRSADIALDQIGSGDKFAVVARRWGVSRGLVRKYKLKWLRLACLHFDVERKRRVC